MDFLNKVDNFTFPLKRKAFKLIKENKFEEAKRRCLTLEKMQSSHFAPVYIKLIEKINIEVDEQHLIMFLRYKDKELIIEFLKKNKLEITKEILYKFVYYNCYNLINKRVIMCFEDEEKSLLFWKKSFYPIVYLILATKTLNIKVSKDILKLISGFLLK